MLAIYLKSREGLNTLRWDFGPVKVDDFIFFINLMATVEPSPKILTVMPAKCPGRKQVIINSGRGPGADGNYFGCINKAKSGELGANDKPLAFFLLG